MTYEGLQRYRDVSMRLEATSTMENPRVGLWAKAFMSDSEYSYVGTLTTMDLYTAVCGRDNKLPGPLPLTQSRQKVSREEAVLRKFRQVRAGPYAEQFSEARLADAIAMCKRDWSHFSKSCGALPADGSRQWMPHQLAAEMRRRGVLGVRGVRVTESVGSASSAGAVGFDPATQPEPLQQRAHVLGRSLQLARSTDMQLVAGIAGGPRTAEEFKVSPVAAGSCVITRPATKTRLALLAPALQGLPFWVWRILRVIDPGSALPANSRRLAAADVIVFEAHLYSPDNGTATGS